MVSSLSEAKFSGSGRSGWPRGGHGVIPAPTVPDTVPHMKSGAVESRRRQRREVCAPLATREKRSFAAEVTGDADSGIVHAGHVRRSAGPLGYSGSARKTLTCFSAASGLAVVSAGPRRGRDPSPGPRLREGGTQLSLHLHCVGSRGGMGVQRCGARIPRVEPHVTGLMRKSSSERGSP